MVRRAWGLSFSIACAVVSASAAARANDPISATLTYSVAEKCPDEASFRDQVTARLGYDPFVQTSTTRVEVNIVRDHGKLAGHATIAANTAGPAIRELTAHNDQCAPLATALAITVAIALDAVGSPKPKPDPQPAPVVPTPPPTIVVVHEQDRDRTEPIAPSPPPTTPERPVFIFGTAGIVGSLGLRRVLHSDPTSVCRQGSNYFHSSFRVASNPRSDM